MYMVQGPFSPPRRRECDLCAVSETTLTIWENTAHEYMMTSSNGNIFRVTGPLCGEFTGPGEFTTQRPVTRSCNVFFDLRLNKRLKKNREAGDSRRYRGHYDVSVMN